MDDDNTNQKKRRSKWKVSYSNMSTADAEKRLGIRVRAIRSVPVKTMLAEANGLEGGMGASLETKEKVYKGIVRYLDVEDFPMDTDPNFKEANINDLVYAIISPILFDFRRETRRSNSNIRSI